MAKQNFQHATFTVWKDKFPNYILQHNKANDTHQPTKEK